MFSDSPPTPEEVEAWKADLEAKEAHYAAIGRVAANWSFFEHEIDSHIITLGELPSIQARCVTAQIAGHGRKLDAYLALADLDSASPKQSTALKNLVKDASGLAELRNRVVHDPWFLVSPREHARRFEVTARRKLRIELVHAPTADVVKLAAHIEALTERFTNLAREILNTRRSPGRTQNALQHTEPE